MQFFRMHICMNDVISAKLKISTKLLSEKMRYFQTESLNLRLLTISGVRRSSANGGLPSVRPVGPGDAEQAAGVALTGQALLAARYRLAHAAEAHFGDRLSREPWVRWKRDYEN